MLWGTGIGQLFFSIRKQHTVNKGTRVQGNGSEYFRGVVFSYSFSIYCAAYHGIWCSDLSTVYDQGAPSPYWSVLLPPPPRKGASVTCVYD